MSDQIEKVQELLNEVSMEMPSAETPAPVTVPETSANPINPINQVEKDIVTKTVNEMMAKFAKEAEDVRMAQRINNPALVAEDLILAADLPEDSKEDAKEFIESFLEDNPGVTAAEISKLTNTIIRKTSESVKASKERALHKHDLTIGALYRKFGEQGTVIFDRLLDHYEAQGVDRHTAQLSFAQMPHDKFIGTIDSFYKNQYITGAATSNKDNFEKQQEDAYLEKIKSFLGTRN